MKVDIIPKGKDKRHHKLYAAAFQYFLDKLMAKRYQDRINYVSIKLVDSLDYGNSHGECKESIRNDGTFDVYIKLVSTVPLPDIISTLAHETVHLKQAVKHELLVFKKNNTEYWVWKGKKMKYSANWYEVFTHEQQCAKLPWEKEAYDLEMELARSFFWKHYTSNY